MINKSSKNRELNSLIEVVLLIKLRSKVKNENVQLKQSEITSVFYLLIFVSISILKSAFNCYHSKSKSSWISSLLCFYSNNYFLKLCALAKLWNIALFNSLALLKIWTSLCQYESSVLLRESRSSSKDCYTLGSWCTYSERY